MMKSMSLLPLSIRKMSKGLKSAYYPLKPLKLYFKTIKGFKIFKTFFFNLKLF